MRSSRVIACLLIGLLLGAVISYRWSGHRSASDTKAGNDAVAPSIQVESAPAPVPQTAPASAPAVVPIATAPKAAELTLAQILKLPRGLERRHALERLGLELARRDVESAWAQLAALSDTTDRAEFLRGMFEQAATLDPKEALGWAKRLSEGKDRFTALSALAGAWVGRELDTQKLAADAERLGWNGALAWSVFDGPGANQKLGLLWAQELMEGRAKTAFLGEAALVIARTNPTEAFALAGLVSEQDKLSIYQNVARGWGAAAPEAAWAWAAQTGDPDARATLQAAVLRAWSAVDPARAASLLDQLPAGKLREGLAAELGSSWGETDTAAALNWINSLPESPERTRAQEALRSVAPVGIGAVLRVGDGGLVEITDLMAGGAAQTQGGLTKGDRIVAVSDAAGQMIDVRSSKLADIVKQIRGDPGSVVRLQVLPAGENDPARARTVEITRAQLIHRKS